MIIPRNPLPISGDDTDLVTYSREQEGSLIAMAIDGLPLSW
jgi:hypothetical protein